MTKSSNAIVWSNLFLFLLGLGSETKTYFYGCLAFSEIVVFLAAPFILLTKYKDIRRGGLLLPIKMIIGLMVMLFVSSWVNRTAYPFVLKSFALMYGVLSYYIVFSNILRENPKGLVWVFVGMAISLVITIFAFNPGAIVSVEGSYYVGELEAADVIRGPLFWIQRLKAFGQIPIMGWYLQTPLAYSLFTPFLFVVFALFSTISGRSASLSILVSVALIAIGRKKRNSMRYIGRHIFTIALICVAIVVSYKAIYTYAARNGHLGRDAQSKYEKQTKTGEGVLKLLMSGRSEFFVSIPAALKRPILGYGPHAEDTEGFYVQFLLKYGAEKDYLVYQARAYHAAARGYRIEIPTHSHIMGAWVHYGIWGLIFYLWLLWTIYKQLRCYMDAIPQWFGYFAMSIGSYLWHIFFSPVGNRMMLGLFIATLFIAKAVGSRKISLPMDVALEAERYS